jgi:hypothetical protein
MECRPNESTLRGDFAPLALTGGDAFFLSASGPLKLNAPSQTNEKRRARGGGSKLLVGTLFACLT